MATTTLALLGDRRANITAVGASVATVAADANISETFILPPGFGDMLIAFWQCEIGTFSANYAAPAPAYDGVQAIITDAANNVVDVAGGSRFINEGQTAATRPFLMCFMDFNKAVLLRQTEKILVGADPLAGAGATVTVTLRLRGLRLRAP